MKRLADEGHLVGNRTMNHPYLNEAIANSVSGYEYELRELENKYRQVTGQELAKFMRPPYGAYSERVLAANQMLGYKTVFWSYGYRDWDTTNQPVRSTALNQLIGQLHNSEVLLLHSVSTTNVSLLGEFIDITRSKGFTFKTVNQMP